MSEIFNLHYAATFRDAQPANNPQHVFDQDFNLARNGSLDPLEVYPDGWSYLSDVSKLYDGIKSGPGGAVSALAWRWSIQNYTANNVGNFYVYELEAYEELQRTNLPTANGPAELIIPL